MTTINASTNTARPVTGPDGDNPIRDEQIRELRDVVRAEIETLIGLKNACLDALDVGTSPQKAAAITRCAAAYNARAMNTETVRYFDAAEAPIDYLARTRGPAGWYWRDAAGQWTHAPNGRVEAEHHAGIVGAAR